ncbi:MAG: TonB-dependent receptor [Sphingomonadales bacterium]|nr:TonB-dependent receptor [Sphingomonadales bacterium]
MQKTFNERKKSFSKPIMTSISALSIAMLPSLGMAQESTADSEEGAGSGEIVVTGSRIKSDGYDQPTPVTAVTTAALLESSPQTIADGLVKLPQFNGSSSRTFCCAPGSLGNFLNLRALGSTRNLILLDGRRITPTRETGDVDVNLLPELLVQRVDVVTGGASATYGSDAVSGVINYITDRKFKGVRATAQAGVSNYADDQSIKLGIAAGSGFAGDRGHFVASLEHFKVNGIPSLADRPDSRRGGFLGGNGSAATPFTNQENVFLITATDGGVIVNPFVGNVPLPNAAAPLAGLVFQPGGSTRPFVLGTQVPGSPGFTFGGDGHQNNMMQPAGLLETDKGFFAASYDFSDVLTGYVRLNAARSHNNMRILSDNRSGAAAFTIFRNNAYLPVATAAAMDAAGQTSFRLGRFNRDFGAITIDYVNKTWDVNAGLEGKIGASMTWNLSYGHGETTLRGEVRNVSDLAKIYASADAVVDPVSGNIVCNVTLTNPGLFPGCVPVNLFGVGAPSEAAKSYFLGTSRQDVKNTQDVFAAELQGALFALPGGDMAFALGGEYRQRSLVEKSNAVALGQIAGTGVRGIPGAFCPTLALCRFGGWNQGNFGEANASDDVKEGFVELIAPVFKDSPIGKSLELNGAYRYTDYKNSGGVSTWKLGVSYEPLDGLRFRATRSRDIRAPNLFELFAGPVNAFTPGLVDPVLGQNNVIAVTRTQGNPGLVPETANTWTAGAVFSPSWLPGFSGSIDYYDIKLTGALAATTAQGTIDGCQRGIAAQCALITRDPVTNVIQQIVLQQINLNARKVRGIDFDFSYARPVGDGTLSIRLLATRMLDFIDTIGTTRTQSAGFFNAANNTALPKWRGNFTIKYDSDAFGLALNERFIGGYNQLPFVPGQIFTEPHIGKILYTDVTATAKIGANTDTKFEMFFTVNNLFNKRPPFLPNRFAANLAFPTVPNLYDLDNRYFTIGVRTQF